jgi:Ca2+/H+ antiporter
MPETMRAMIYAVVMPQSLYLMGMCWLVAGINAVQGVRR